MVAPIRVLCVGTDDAASRLEAAEDTIAARSVASVDEGTAVLSEWSPDCLLVAGDRDVVLGLLEWTREADVEVPVLLSGGSDALVDDALDAGVADVVPTDAQTRVLTSRIENVVEQSRARATARERDRRLHTLLNSSSDRLSVLDEEGTYTFVSPAVERLLGYDPEELLGTSGFNYVHPDDRGHVEEVFERILENPSETHSLEYRIRDADGEWRWVESRGTNFLDDPAIDGIVVNSREISERKERERKFIEERAFTESIFAALPDVFYAFDEGGTFLRWNDRLSEVTGYSDEEIASMHPSEFIADEDVDIVLEAIAKVFEHDTTVSVEARFETKDGERIPYEFTGAKMTDDTGDPLGLVGIGRDISDRKKRQRRFEAVFNNTYQFTGLMEPDGTLVEANETALVFGGLDRAEVVGKKLWNAHWFQDNEEAREIAREAVEQARSGELYREEVTVKGSDDTEVIDFSVRPIVDEHGDVRLLIPEGRTITELKQRERHLGVLHRFLRHNLRNKMTVIETTADLLEAKADDSEYGEHVERIQCAAAELIELSETAHELSQVAVDVDSDPRPIDLDRALTNVVADIRDSYPAATVESLSSIEQYVCADWRLETALEQLVENAIEHADHDEPTVEISVDEVDDTVAVRIADDGPGIPEDELSGITTDREQNQLTHGTGFGLWLVRSVIDDYGGDLSYEPAADGGSVLVVTLQPATGPETEQTGTATEP